MRTEIIKCEMCENTHIAEFKLPHEWIVTRQSSQERDYCSRACLAKSLGVSSEPHIAPPATKMRRFLLIDGETADEIEGVKWGNGCVSIDPEQGKTQDFWFYRDWEEFKAAHDGCGVQWIDQEAEEVSHAAN